ncbi:hypothetical protein ACOI1C_01210 [Bacillus sp. DJP31]|uniref:hypothetical protein n=1 Tax=Bacillus sp. DJP31 TaxID=3409789 RepID=UPI003BB55DA5
MTTLLWIISFILHGVSFLIIILFYIRLEQTKDIERNQTSNLKDMEDLLSAYITEIKDENEAFFEKTKLEAKAHVSHSTSSKNLDETVNPVTKQSRINRVEEQLTDLDLATLLPTYENPDELKKINTDTVVLKRGSSSDKDNSEEQMSLGQQARLLYNNGLSVEEVAKKLKKGKTEIELFLKFNV